MHAFFFTDFATLKNPWIVKRQELTPDTTMYNFSWRGCSWVTFSPKSWTYLEWGAEQSHYSCLQICSSSSLMGFSYFLPICSWVYDFLIISRIIYIRHINLSFFSYIAYIFPVYHFKHLPWHEYLLNVSMFSPL